MHLQELNPLLEERQGSTEYHVQHNKASGLSNKFNNLLNINLTDLEIFYIG